MKAGIHPQVYTDAQVTCLCGVSFITISTKPTIKVDLCSKCHPFYTGEQKLIDTRGHVKRFEEKMKKAAVYKAANPSKKKGQVKSDRPTKSLSELLAEM